MPAPLRGWRPPMPLILAILACAATLALARASPTTNHMMQTCTKKFTQDKMTDRCFGFRRRRRAAPVEARLPPADFARSAADASTRSRQIMSIREIIVSSRVPMHDPATPVSSSRRESVPIVPRSDPHFYQTPRKFEPLPQGSSSDPSLDDDYKEIVELFNEIYERMPRSPKPRARAFAEFSEAQLACCRNEKFCDCPIFRNIFA